MDARSDPGSSCRKRKHCKSAPDDECVKLTISLPCLVLVTDVPLFTTDEDGVHKKPVLCIDKATNDLFATATAKPSG